MKTFKRITYFFLVAALISSCTSAIDEVVPDEPTSSTNELLVKRFETAPIMDGHIDAVWESARPLLNTLTVPDAGVRTAPFNPDGTLGTEPLGIFDPYTGESNKISLRAGHDGEYIYMLLEVDDPQDSRARLPYFFDPKTQTWHQQHKYANYVHDKWYEDKFAMMFPIKDASGAIPAGWNDNTCTMTCHKNLPGATAGQKATRHYMAVDGELTDLWHWKRDRNVLSESVDDGYVTYVSNAGTAAANGRKGDAGVKMYNDKMVFTDATTGFQGPKYIVPDKENYYWITDAEIADYTAKKVVGVAADGTLTYVDDAAGTLKTLNPNDDLESYAAVTGSKRFPSITVNPGANDFRTDPMVQAVHTGTGWIIEIKRKLNTGDPYDAVFEIGESMKFGISYFNNAAIAHETLNLLTLKIEN